jgi:hypothetical protein
VVEPVGQPAVAERAGPNCDALKDQYILSRDKEASLFKVALLSVYATAVLVIIATATVIFGMTNAEVAAAGVALLSSVAAGGIATWYWRAHKDTLARLRQWIAACPDPDGGLAQLI